MSEAKTVCPLCGGIGVVFRTEKIVGGYRGEVDTCPDCRGTGQVPVTITRGDAIRAMSDEELAAFLANPCQCDVDPERDGPRECGNDLCLKYLRGWLQQPAEEDT